MFYRQLKCLSSCPDPLQSDKNTADKTQTLFFHTSGHKLYTHSPGKYGGGHTPTISHPSAMQNKGIRPCMNYFKKQHSSERHGGQKVKPYNCNIPGLIQPGTFAVCHSPLFLLRFLSASPLSLSNTGNNIAKKKVSQ